MKLKGLMIIKALVCLVMGVPILAVPIFFYSLFGIKIDAAGALVGREYGASLIGNLLVTWFARNAVDSDARRAIILGLCVYDLIGFIFFLVAQLAGMMNPARLVGRGDLSLLCRWLRIFLFQESKALILDLTPMEWLSWGK